MMRPLSGAALVLVLLTLGVGQDDSKKEARDHERAVQELENRAMSSMQKLDGSGLNEALAALVQFNDLASASAVLSLVGRAPSKEERVYWSVVRAAAAFTSREALQKIGDYLVGRRDALGKDLLYALTGNYSPAMVAVLREVLARSSDELKSLAADHAANLRFMDMVEVLIASLEREQGKRASAVAARIVRSLGILTGVDHGENLGGWKAWHEKHKEEPLPKRGASPRPATGTITDTLDPVREEELDKIRGPIVVIRAQCRDPQRQHNFDSIEAVLTQMKIPHAVISKEEFEDPSFVATDKMAILINCHYWKAHCVCPDCSGNGRTSGRSQGCQGCNKHDTITYSMSDKGIQKLREFVNKGGYLFTEDWQLEELMERAFPGTITHGPYLPGQTVDIFPAPGFTSHPYLRHIFVKPPAPTGKGGTISESSFDPIPQQWVIDKDSPSIKVSGRSVTVLIVSPQLEKSGDNSVAVTFSYGQGRVVHTLSHFGKQVANSTTGKEHQGDATIQHLMLNYLLEASRKWNESKGKKKE